MRFPDRTTNIGSILDSYLKCKSETEDHAIHLLFSANRWEAKTKIQQHISQGTTVIIDRYAYSGVAYTATKGIELDWCKNPDRGLPKPDLVVFLNISIAESSKRGNFGDERYENRESQEKVFAIFHRFCKEEDNWQAVDAARDKEEVHKDICRIVCSKIEGERKALGGLWV